MLKNIYFITVAILIFTSCRPPIRPTMVIPPNDVRITDNFYCDQTEVSNINWREYMVWMQKIYGIDSEQYVSTIPDTAVWHNLDTCSIPFASDYFKSHIYYDYPVTGVTQKQAMDYSKWRSDRVFEVYLVNQKLIKHDPEQTKETFFSIERYYAGNLTTLLTKEKIKYYPLFRLPTPGERKIILDYSDAVDLKYLKRCWSKNCKECLENFPKIVSDIVICTSATNGKPPVVKVTEGCYTEKGHPIYNLRGNAGEWTSEKNISSGGSWADKKQVIMLTDTFRIEMVNAGTGFRNVFEWKEWKN